MRLSRLLPLAAVLLAVAAAPASGDVSSRKAAIDAKLQAVQAKIEWAQRRERDLELHKRKLDRLNELYRVQTARFTFFEHEYDMLIERLGNRLIDLYEGGEPSTLEVLLASKSVSDLISQAQYVESIGQQDKHIADEVGGAKERVRVQREHTKRFRRLVAAETRTIAVRAGQVRALRDQLLANENRLAAARATKRESLDDVKETKAEFLHEAAGLVQASAALAGSIRSAQSSSSYAPGDTTPSAAGFIWPVNGPVTSGFGWRWGRMHEGIDIGVGYGTPIHAAASGRVIYSGWMSGYGNLVAIDHGNGVSTAYGHQSSIAAGLGQIVSQGQTIGYVGCTGHCYGDHLHFEVRINGAPVDPLGYL
jgi:murein DD-endopeptidase MepM/ murein hydrolase activator NlpD